MREPPLDTTSMVGTHDIVLLTLDTLRFDVADRLHREGRTPHFAALFPSGWEKRLTPGSFTYAAHHAFFAGFLPVPLSPGPHPRLFACAFEGSETIGPRTAVFDAPTIVQGLADVGYHTVCIGGVGFFNMRTPLGRTLPSLFREAHWSRQLSVTDPASPRHQVELAASRLRDTKSRVFLFVNFSAIHQPNHFYVEGATTDDLTTHAAALEAVDRALPPLLEALRVRGPTLIVACSDHGTAYGEDGHVGHRTPHPVVWTVPYGERVLFPT